MKAKLQLGELLVKRNLATREQVNQALKIQVSGNRRLGYLLIKMGVLDEEQLINALAEQLELPVVEVDQEFSAEVKGVLPRYLCRKYGVLPLQKRGNNIIMLAMTDPLDHQAIADIENYTGLVVQPSLAKHGDILRSINRRIPLGLKDLFNMHNYGLVARVALVVVVGILVVTSIYTGRYVYQEVYGTVSVTADSTVYKNHDLMVGVDSSGKIALLGRGARAAGYYSVTFSDPAGLRAFLEQKRDHFSEKQYKWLNWVIAHRLQRSAGARIAASQ